MIFVFIQLSLTQIYSTIIYIKIRVYQLDCNSRSNPAMMEGEIVRIFSKSKGKEKKRVPRRYPRVFQKSRNHSGIIANSADKTTRKQRVNHPRHYYVITRFLIRLGY